MSEVNWSDTYHDINLSIALLLNVQEVIAAKDLSAEETYDETVMNLVAKACDFLDGILLNMHEYLDEDGKVKKEEDEETDES